MSSVGPEPAGSSLVGRAWALLARPELAWEQIDDEPTTPRALFQFWVAPLAAIPAICDAVGRLAFGVGIFGVGLRPSLGAAVGQMLAGYIVSLATVFLLGLVIDLLAGPFDGQRDRLQGLKVAAYAGTAFWLAGIFSLYPPIGWLAAILGLIWSLFLLYRGLTILMRAPPEHQLSYFAVVLLSGLGIVLVLGAVTAWIRDLGGPLAAVA